LNPEYSQIFSLIGDVYWREENYALAVKHYSKAIEKDPGFMSVYYKRAHAKRKLQDYDGAINDYNKFIELNPNIGNITLTKAIKTLFRKELKEAGFYYSSFN